jgi:hypothetical protein
MSARRPLPPWQTVYQAAILEPDRDKVPSRVENARKTLGDRLRELDPQRPDERWEVDRALNALRMLALLDKTTDASQSA